MNGESSSIIGRFLNYLVELIETISNFSDVFGFIIIIIAVSSFIVCHKDLLKVNKDLKKFVKNKDKLINTNRDKFEYISKSIFTKSSHMALLWRRYEKETRMKSIDGRVPDIGNCFNKTTIIDALGKRQLAQIIPGTLTALGILGTFLGLQDGVSNLQTGNTEMIQESIGSLTQGMSLAFITSILGIFFSAIWLAADRKLYKSYMDNISRFRQAFEERFEYFYIESFMNEMLSLKRESTDATKRMATDMSLEFAKALNESMGSVSTSIKDFTTQTSQSQVTAMEGFTNNFSEDLNELKSTLKELTSWHKEVKGALSKVLGEIKESSKDYKEINTSLGSTSDKYMAMVDSLTEMNEEMHENMIATFRITDDLKDVALSNSTTVKDMNLFHELNKEYLKNSEESFKNINNDLNDIREGIELMSSELDKSTINFSESLKDGLDTTFNIFDSNLSEISKRLSGTILEINESVDDIPDIIRYLHSEIQTHTVDLKEAMEAATKLYGKIANENEMIE